MRAIDADALIDDCKKYLNKLNPSRDGKECTRIHWLIGILSNAPTIEERKNGKWILHPEQEKNIFDVKTIECSACGDKCLVQCVEKEKYCRNCGAKMEGTE